jgi:hypothetical protein
LLSYLYYLFLLSYPSPLVAPCWSAVDANL